MGKDQHSRWRRHHLDVRRRVRDVNPLLSMVMMDTEEEGRKKALAEALAARVEEFYNTCHEDGTGRFCEAHGGIHEAGGEVRSASGTELMAEGRRLKREGNGTKKFPIRTSDVEVAAKALAEGRHVELTQPDQVSTLLDKLSVMVADAKAKGAEAPMYNLCGVTVKGSNLFCTESKGIPRVKMPQLASKNPVPGSKADLLPRNENGEVDLSVQFADHLRSKGVSVKGQDVAASHLRATQNELNGAKVAAIAKQAEAGKLPPGSIFVSRGNYVVDGHHRWAAVVGNDLRDNKAGDLSIAVKKIDMPIIDVLREANDFSREWGIPQAKA